MSLIKVFTKRSVWLSYPQQTLSTEWPQKTVYHPPQLTVNISFLCMRFILHIHKIHVQPTRGWAGAAGGCCCKPRSRLQRPNVPRTRNFALHFHPCCQATGIAWTLNAAPSPIAGGSGSASPTATLLTSLLDPAAGSPSWAAVGEKWTALLTPEVSTSCKLLLRTRYRDHHHLQAKYKHLSRRWAT